MSYGIHLKKVWTRNGKHLIKRKWQCFARKRATIRIVKKCEHECGNTTGFPAEVVRLALVNKVGLILHRRIAAICSLLNPRYWHCLGLFYNELQNNSSIQTVHPATSIYYQIPPFSSWSTLLSNCVSAFRKQNVTFCTFQMPFSNRSQVVKMLNTKCF